MARPVHEVRIGLIKARAWRRRTRTGPHYSISVVRLYCDGDLWKESTRFGRDDVPALRHALDRLHSWILERTLEAGS